MVIVEEINSEAFNQLPTMNGFKPVYKWGNELHLIKQLQLFEKDGKSPYPLIYQTSNRSEQNATTEIAETNLVLILACRNLETDLLNENRWEMTYKNILYPLVSNITTVFNKSGVYIWDGSFSVEEFPNYGNGKENKTVDIWDALLFKATIKIEGKKCIKQIKF
jgi:hypothetical protein